MPPATTPDLKVCDSVNGEIRAELARRRISQAALSAHLSAEMPDGKFSQAAVSDRLTGRTEWRLSELFAVARLLNLPLSALIAPAERVPA